MLFFSGRSRIERDARSPLDPSTVANEGPGDPESVEYRDLPLDLAATPVIAEVEIKIRMPIRQSAPFDASQSDRNN
jgi:hypothetical protein